MRKLFLLGAFALSTFAFANKSDVKSEVSVKKETSVKVKEMIQEQKLAFLKAWWGVTIGTTCGPVNVYFTSNYADGTPEFIADLAYSVNYAYDHCQPQGIELN
jgi:hypothetical protein